MPLMPTLLAIVVPTADDVPTGEDPQTVGRFYDWLYEHYLNRNPNSPLRSDNALSEASQWDIAWLGPVLQLASVAVILIAVFWVFAWFFNHPRRHRSMLYKPSSFGGQITERYGRFGWFNRIAYVAIVAWALYYAVDHVLTGQVY